MPCSGSPVPGQQRLHPCLHFRERRNRPRVLKSALSGNPLAESAAPMPSLFLRRQEYSRPASCAAGPPETPHSPLPRLPATAPPPPAPDHRDAASVHPSALSEYAPAPACPAFVTTPAFPPGTAHPGCCRQLPVPPSVPDLRAMPEPPLSPPLRPASPTQSKHRRRRPSSVRPPATRPPISRHRAPISAPNARPLPKLPWIRCRCQVRI
jgi:hypothetical protein